MRDFSGKLAVVTGGGSGMGRELARLLASEGCDIAMCDVSVEEDVLAFRDAVAREHGTDHINLLFNNAGIGGAGSFVLDDRGDW